MDKLNTLPLSPATKKRTKERLQLFVYKSENRPRRLVGGTEVDEVTQQAYRMATAAVMETHRQVSYKLFCLISRERDGVDLEDDCGPSSVQFSSVQFSSIP